MKTLFYPKLAVNGMKKNKRLYLPYILTLVAMVMMMYITAYLARSENIANTNRGVYAQWCLWHGIIVIGIFSLIFLFYSYFVLIKNRGKEFGLYNILGMNKRNIARILLCESLFTLIISLLCGLAAGILLSRLAELCMFRLLGIEPVGNLSVDAGAIAITAAVFTAITIILLLSAFVRIGRLSAINLLQSEKQGEKPPRANFVFALVGLILLAIAYYIAVTTQAGIEIVGNFFLAVLLVIIGTYMLFVSGSVALCRLLMKNKRYYYKANHFVSVSGMTYRMKRNGAGLASVCILSTMVLVMLSSTISLFSGIQTSTFIRSRDISVTLTYDSFEDKTIRNISDLCNTAIADCCGISWRIYNCIVAVCIFFNNESSFIATRSQYVPSGNDFCGITGFIFPSFSATSRIFLTTSQLSIVISAIALSAGQSGKLIRRISALMPCLCSSNCSFSISKVFSFDTGGFPLRAFVYASKMLAFSDFISTD